MSIGSFYSYFRNKKQLLMEAINYYDEQIRKAMDTESAMNEPASSTDRVEREALVRRFINSTIQAHMVKPAFQREIAAVSILDPDIRKLVHEQENRQMEHIYGLLNVWASEGCTFSPGLH